MKRNKREESVWRRCRKVRSWEQFEINEVGRVDIGRLSCRMDKPRVMI